MNMPFLLALAATKGNASRLAQAALLGDESALYPLQDALLEEFDVNDLEIGKNYYIETVTHYWTGKLVKSSLTLLTLDKACKIFDAGRFTDFLKGGIPNECEPVPDGMLSRVPVASITLIVDWPHELIRKQATGGHYVTQMGD